MVPKKIEAIGGEGIAVVTAEEPEAGSISGKIRTDIDRCDAIFCLLTRRSRDLDRRFWLPPPYVLTESAFGAGRYAHSPGKHVYGFIEAGIDRKGLGIAFSSDIQTPEFTRTNLQATEAELTSFVSSILRKRREVLNPFEAKRLHKKVLVRRDGFVVVQSKYTFLIVDAERFSPRRVQHYLWHVGEPLPPFQEMLEADANPRANKAFLAGWFRGCNGNDPRAVSMDLVLVKTVHDGREVVFDVKFRGLKPQAYSTLEYHLAWGYPRAFIDNVTLGSSGEFSYNSVGLRSWNRGAIGEAILEISYERNLNDGTECPIFDMVPQVASSTAHECPAGLEPEGVLDRQPIVVRRKYNAPVRAVE